MVAQSLEQDGSWSLESSQGWLMLVGHKTQDNTTQNPH